MRIFGKETTGRNGVAGPVVQVTGQMDNFRAPGLITLKPAPRQTAPRLYLAAPAPGGKFVVLKIRKRMPLWCTLLLSLAAGLGLVGLCFSIGGLLRLSNPTENFFQFPASQAAFRFQLSQAGPYDLRCTRAGRWGNGFEVPRLTLELRPLPAGPPQLIQTSNWNFMRQTTMSGETTVTIGGFEAPAPGEYELRNPDGQRFGPGDRLSIQPPSSGQTTLLILALIASAVLLLGGFIGGLLGWVAWLQRAA